MNKIVYDITKLVQTEQLATIISKLVKPNMIIFLRGDLGVGKTSFSQFLGKKLGVKAKITSPTFVILNEYMTNKSFSLIHIDAYRLNKTSNFYEYYDYMINNFTIIEWPENINFPFIDHKIIVINISFVDKKRIAVITSANLTEAELAIISKNC